MAQIPVALNAGHLAARLEAQADNPDGAVAAPAPVLPAVNPEHAVQAEQVQQAQQPPQVCSQFCADSCSCWRFSHMLPVQLCRMSGLCLFSVVFFQLVVSFSPMFVVTSTGCALLVFLPLVQFFSVHVYVFSRIFCLVYLPSLSLSGRICYSFTFVA